MKFFLRSAIIAALASLATPVIAQTTDWDPINKDNLSSSGTFEAGPNWSNGVPNATTAGFVTFSGTIAINNVLVDPTPTIAITESTNQSAGAMIFEGIIDSAFPTQKPGTIDFKISQGSTLTITGNAGFEGLEVAEGVVTNISGGGTISVQSGGVEVGFDANGGTLNLLGGTYDFGVTSNSDFIVVGSGTKATGILNESAGANVTNTNGIGVEVGTFGGSGTYSLTTGSSLTLASGSELDLGNATMSVDGTSTVNLNNTGAFVGTASGENATFQLDGTLNVTNGVFEIGNAGVGSLVQTGTLNVTSSAEFIVGGGAGVGTYTISGGTATFDSSTNVIIGGDTSGSGTVIQSGTSSVTFNGSVGIGTGAGIGTYNLQGGTVTVADSLAVGSNGTILQTGGVFQVTNGSILAIDSGGAYNLNGGQLKVDADKLEGPGNLNFGGGTLTFTGGTSFTDTFAGHTLLANTTSTIDASLAGLNSVTFSNVSGSGNIAFLGNGATVFNLNDGTSTLSGSVGVSGGTLNVSGADIQNTSALSIASDSVGNLTLAAGGLNYAGALKGGGTLNVNYNTAGDTLTINSASSFTGPIVLGANGVQGQLQVFSGSIGNISDNGTGSNLIVGSAPTPGLTGGTVSMTNSSYTGTTTVYQQFTLNALNQTGAISGGGTQTLGNIHGSVNNMGTLNATGTVGAISGGTTVNYTAVNGPLTNSGTFMLSSGFGNVSGNSTVNYIGINGDVDNSGTLLVGQSVGTVEAGSTTNFADIQGSLTNSGTFGSLDTLSTPGTPTAHITGNFTSPGTLNIRILGTTSDLIQVDGVADLTNGTLNVTGSGKVGVDTFEIVHANGGIADTSLTKTADTALLSSVIAPLSDPDTLYLIVTQKAIGTFAITGNQSAVAAALDSSPTGNPIKSVFNTLTPAQAPTIIPVALDQLSPEALQYARNIAFENATFMVQNMNGVMANIRNGYSGIDSSGLGFVTPGFSNGLGRSLSSLTAANDPYRGAAPNGVNYYPGTEAPSNDVPSPYSAPSPWAGTESSGTISDSPVQLRTTSGPPALREPSFSGFVGGDVVLADLNQNNGVGNAPPGKANYTGGDVVAGVAYHVNSHFSAGVLFDYNHTDADIDANGSKTKIDTYSPGIFATYYDKNFYVNGLFSFGYNDYENTRNIPFAGATASSSPTGEQYVTNLDVGYDFHPARQWTVGPTLGMTYTHLDIDSFNESGAGAADLSVNEQHADSFRSRLGGHVAYQARVGSIVFEPNVFAMWQHEFLDQASGITSQFNIPGSNSFTIQTASSGKDTALAGVGLTASLDSSMVIYLNYMVNAGASDYFAQSVMAGFKASF